MIDIFKYTGQLPEKLKSRTQINDDAVNSSVKAIIADVRKRGDKAVLEYTEKFDKVKVSDMRVSRQEIDEAIEKVDPKLMDAIERAIVNITAFHEKQKRLSFMDYNGDITLGQLILPIENVGVYVPGGIAAYPSSVLMNIIPAKVAGSKRIVMVTPPMSDGKVYPLTLAAADLAGADEIYKVGGAQAVAALAYGTESIAPVDKIVGPGNIFVANAKREVYGTVGIDMIAGPSEIMVVADESADPDFIAADLLSQAEHGPNGAVCLAVLGMDVAEKCAKALDEQIAKLERSEIAKKVVADYGAIIVVDNYEDAMECANLFAPEHLELCVNDPYALLPYVKHAGSIFLGHYSPEPLGDYFSGQNHVLPTSGTARFSSPLGVDDFIKRSSVVYYTKRALIEAAPYIEAFANAEGLGAHAESIAIRRRKAEEENK